MLGHEPSTVTRSRLLSRIAAPAPWAGLRTSNRHRAASVASRMRLRRSISKVRTQQRLALLVVGREPSRAIASLGPHRRLGSTPCAITQHRGAVPLVCRHIEMLSDGSAVTLRPATPRAQEMTAPTRCHHSESNRPRGSGAPFPAKPRTSARARPVGRAGTPAPDRPMILGQVCYRHDAGSSSISLPARAVDFCGASPFSRCAAFSLTHGSPGSHWPPCR